MLDKKVRKALKEAVGSNGAPNKYPRLKVTEFDGIHTIKNNGEVVAVIDARWNAELKTANAQDVLDAIVEYWTY